MKKILQFIQYFGIRGTLKKIFYRYNFSYERYNKENEPFSKQQQQVLMKDWEYFPKISVITPLYNPKIEELTAYFDSIFQNGYPNIEICLVNDGFIDKKVDALITNYSARFSQQIKYQRNEKNLGISCASNDALTLASGEYIALVDQDDVIAIDAFFWYVKALQEVKYDFLYSDEDMITEDGKRFNPQVKPDWSPHTLLSRMYVNHLSMYKKSIVQQVGGFRKEFDGCQDYDLLLRASTYFKEVYHCERILYHWRTSENSIATSVDNKHYIYERSQKALEEKIKTESLSVRVKSHKKLLIYDVFLENTKILKTKGILFVILEDDQINRTDMIDKMISNNPILEGWNVCFINRNPSFIEKYDNLDSFDVINDDEIEAYINRTKLDYFLFVYEGIQFVDAGLVEKMINLTKLPKTGIVAPTIVNDKNIIQQNGGIIFDNGNIAYSGYGFEFTESDYYGINLSLVNYCIVPYKTFLFSRELYEAIDFKYNFLDRKVNFIDFCLEVMHRGYFNVLDGSIKVVDSSSKKKQNFIQLNTEQKRIIYDKWKYFMENDPFYNKAFYKDEELLYKIKR